MYLVLLTILVSLKCGQSYLYVFHFMEYIEWWIFHEILRIQYLVISVNTFYEDFCKYIIYCFRSLFFRWNFCTKFMWELYSVAISIITFDNTFFELLYIQTPLFHTPIFWSSSYYYLSIAWKHTYCVQYSKRRKYSRSIKYKN